MNRKLLQFLFLLVFSSKIMAADLRKHLNEIINTSNIISFVKYEPLMSGSSVFTFTNEKNQLIMVKAVYVRENSKLVFTGFALGIDEIYEHYENSASIGNNFHKLMKSILDIDVSKIENKADRSYLLHLRKTYQAFNEKLIQISPK